jgi:hypothetical protein
VDGGVFLTVEVEVLLILAILNGREVVVLVVWVEISMEVQELMEMETLQ